MKLLHLRFFLVIIVAIYALKVCKIFGPNIRLCKFFDKSQVWDLVDEKIENVNMGKSENTRKLNSKRWEKT